MYFQYCYKNNLSCFEKLSTIPGTIGGAIISNAGCFGANIFDNLVSIKILKNGKIKTLK
ncbi:MAG: FAD-binding protein, partial [Clostridia bacterium]|nr:FAD-binding protein [Clostridia bacterium]